MSPLLPLDPAWTGWLAGLLLHAVWIAAAVGVLAWATLVPLRDPRLRHGVAAAALAAIAVGVLIAGAATWPRTEDPVRAPIAIRGATTAPPPAAMDPAQTASSTPVPSTVETDIRAHATAWMVTVWMAGVALLALRHGVGHLRIRRLRAGALPADPDLLALVATKSRRLGAPLPRVLLCDRIRVPAVTGWLRPVLLLPLGVVSALPPAQLEALILHELAHLRRRDALIEAGVTLLECLLFFHPAVWWLGRELREAREQCCDREALAAGAAADGLARGLLAVADGAIAPAPALAATGGQLTERVRRILGLPGPRRWRMRGLMASAVVPALAVAATACAARSEPPTASLRDALVAVIGADPRLPLERRIRARADGRAIVTVCRVVGGDAAFWARAGIDGAGPVVLTVDQAERLLPPEGADRDATTLVTRPLQSAWATAAQEYAYLADYLPVDGVPDPIFRQIRLGKSLGVCLEPGPDGSIQVISARHLGAELIGTPTATLTLSTSATRADRPVEELILRILEGAVGDQGLRLAPGQALAIPLRMQVVRHRASARDWATSVAEGPAIAIPDAASTPRAMLILRSRIDPGRLAPEPRLSVAPEAAWFAGTRISLTAADEPLPQVLVRLAAQLPVPTALERHPDHAATRVTITSRDEAIEDVLARLLPQTLLDAKAEPTGLRLGGPQGAASAPVDLGTPITGNGQPTAGAQTAAPFDLLPWPRVGEPAQQRMYEVSDLIPAGPRSVEGWTIHTEPAGAADARELVQRLRALIPADAWDGGRGIRVVDRRGLIQVEAAAAVHDVVAAGLAGLRIAGRGTIVLRIDLLDLSRLTQPPEWDSKAMRLTSDLTLVETLMDEARGMTPRAMSDAVTISVMPGQRSILATTGIGWMQDFRVELVPFPTHDQRFITLDLTTTARDTTSGETRKRRISAPVWDGGFMLLTTADRRIALGVRATTR
jgi:beta-lactamase regulating signal transducer with metallopeptidase domain